mmetsp:Transcript_27971/g.60934  ORF Transcript_27971/g.60934 Transcript_27971/m.60934 type:complete len:495 (-) Transcript_27971:15-1499(-)
MKRRYPFQRARKIVPGGRTGTSTLMTAIRLLVAFSVSVPFVDGSSAFNAIIAPRKSVRRLAGQVLVGRLADGGNYRTSLANNSSRAGYCRTKILQFASEYDADYATTSNKEKTLGALVLLTVPLAWGTYAPVVKFVYDMDPPVPGFLFSTAYYLIASASLLFLMNMTAENDIADLQSLNGVNGEVRTEACGTGAALPIRGGVELGAYLFLGNCLQVVGLQTVPADRAAFLVQLTTIMVPLAQAAFARDIFAIGAKTWIACLLAFGGVVVMGFDGKELNSSVGDSSKVLTLSLSSITDTLSGGDLLIIMAAVAYTMHVVRLGKYAQSSTPLRLAAAKASSEAVMSLVLIIGLVSVNNGVFGNNAPGFLEKTGHEVATYLSAFGESFSAADTSTLLPALGACLWTGWVTCAYTIYAQSFGQRRVSPTDANLIYTTQPLFSSLFAFALLGETLGAPGIVGGSLIAAALWLITTSEDDGNDTTKEEAKATAQINVIQS